MLPENTRALAFSAPANLSISTFHRPYGPRLHRDEEASGGGLTSSVEVPADAPATFSSATSAASYLASLRHKKSAAESESAPEPEAAAPEAEDESPPLAEEDTAPPPEVPGEEPEDAEPAEKLPPIERPRSWSKDDEDDWNALPRARQEKIAAREQARDREIRQGQNENAEAKKAAQAQVAQAEQARTQYEGKLKSVVEVLEKEQLRDFPDIRSLADLDKMSNDMLRMVETDPLESLRLQARLRAWDTHQQKMQAAHSDLQQSEVRKTETAQSEWAQHIHAENAKAAEAIPELADKEKGAALQKRGAEWLAERFSQAELNDLASGKAKISVYDHRFQQLIKSAMDLADLQAARKVALKPAPKPVPPVQRPGTPAPRGSEISARVKDLDSKLNNSGSQKDAFALMIARRNAARR